MYNTSNTSSKIGVCPVYTLSKIKVFNRLINLIWIGKILGTKANYIVAEVEFREGEDPHRESDDEDEETNSQQVIFSAVFIFSLVGGNAIKYLTKIRYVLRKTRDSSTNKEICTFLRNVFWLAHTFFRNVTNWFYVEISYL